MMTMTTDGLDDSNDFVTFFLLFWMAFSGMGIGHGMDGVLVCFIRMHKEIFRFSFSFLVTRILNYGSYTV